MAHIPLSDGEWKLMKTLWEKQPRTLAELVSALDKDTGWSRATIFMMLKRLIAKGTVTMDSSGKFQKYSAAITCEDVRTRIEQAVDDRRSALICGLVQFGHGDCVQVMRVG